MSSSSNQVSSADSGKWSRFGGVRERGMPQACRCGQGSVIRTSGTSKNPGRLFHCCPHRSDGDQNHLFKWTDECMVEEIEDLKSVIIENKGDLSDLRSTVLGYEKQIEALKTTVHGYENQIDDLKNEIIKCEQSGKEYLDDVRLMKKLMVCGIGIVAFYYYFVS